MKSLYPARGDEQGRERGIWAGGGRWLSWTHINDIEGERAELLRMFQPRGMSERYSAPGRRVCIRYWTIEWRLDACRCSWSSKEWGRGRATIRPLVTEQKSGVRRSFVFHWCTCCYFCSNSKFNWRNIISRAVRKVECAMKVFCDDNGHDKVVRRDYDGSGWKGGQHGRFLLTRSIVDSLSWWHWACRSSTDLRKIQGSPSFPFFWLCNANKVSTTPRELALLQLEGRQSSTANEKIECLSFDPGLLLGHYKIWERVYTPVCTLFSCRCSPAAFRNSWSLPHPPPAQTRNVGWTTWS